MPKRTVKTIIPPDCIFRFRAKTRPEGDGVRVTIPAAVIRGLRHLGWDEKWLRIQLGQTTFHAVARTQGASMIISLPKRYRGDVIAGDVIDLEIRDAADNQCESDALLTKDCLDWGAVVPADTFATEEDDTLVIHTKYAAPFRMKRFTPLHETMWLLGFYQAEGSKKGANEWTLANKTPELIERTIECLAAMGIGRDRLYFEVIKNPVQTAAEACAPYENLGVELRHCRDRSFRSKGGYEACTVHLKSSKPLMRMTCQILRWIVDDGGVEELPPEAARAYAVGWLDGDGTVTISKQRQTWLRAFGNAAECEAVRCALNRGFSWALAPKNHKTASEGVLWGLDASRAAELALAGAFRGLQSRVRLLEIVSRQASRLTTRRRGPWERWGYLTNGALTPKGEAFLRHAAELRTETNAHHAAGRADAMGVVGRKGAG